MSLHDWHNNDKTDLRLYLLGANFFKLNTTDNQDLILNNYPLFFFTLFVLKLSTNSCTRFFLYLIQKDKIMHFYSMK
jgi:hypothetical protein